VRILKHNLEQFKHWQYTLLALKATSIDSSRKPIDVLRSATDEIQSWGSAYISETIDISSYHKGHFFLVMRNILQ
jgi:Fibrillarin-like rRNA methylase